MSSYDIRIGHEFVMHHDFRPRKCHTLTTCLLYRGDRYTTKQTP